MAVQIFQFLSIILTALCLVPGGAHLLELPNKIGLEPEAYKTIQQLYRGWALAGVVLVGAMVSTGILAFLSRSQGPSLLLALASLILLAATLATFFVFVLPVNRATRNWTTLPADWADMRTRWEYTHAANAGITFFALVCVVLSALTWSD